MDTKVYSRQLIVEAKFFKGLADKSRLAILEALTDDVKTVAEIVEITGLSQPNVSSHLSCLLECGLVDRTRQGKHMLYRITSEQTKQIFKLMRGIVAEHSRELYNCTRY